MKITFEITDADRKLLLSLCQLLLTDDQCDLLISACDGRTFPVAALSAAIGTLTAALEPTEADRTAEQARLDQVERLSCRLPSGGIGGFK